MIFTTLDLLRIWYGPLPSIICTFGIMVKNYYFVSAVLIIASVTFMKFLFLCVLKRIPEMDDDYIATCIIRCVLFVILLVCGTKFWNEKPNMQHVSKQLFF